MNVVQRQIREYGSTTAQIHNGIPKVLLNPKLTEDA